MKDRPRAFLVKDTGKLERDRMVGVVMKVGKEGEGVVGTVPALPLSAVILGKLLSFSGPWFICKVEACLTEW